MSDHKRSSPPEGALLDPPVDESVGAASRRWTRLEIIAAVIASVLAVGVVVAALDMKFEADQARWQQRQTCLEWYRLQADYGLGPWYEKLSEAAADCGGGQTDDGAPAVPGGSAPAVAEDSLPAEAPTATDSGGDGTGPASGGNGGGSTTVPGQGLTETTAVVPSAP